MRGARYRTLPQKQQPPSPESLAMNLPSSGEATPTVCLPERDSREPRRDGHYCPGDGSARADGAPHHIRG